MPLDASIMDADLGYQIADLATTVTIAGADYQGSRSMLRREDVLADEGLRDQYRFSVTVQASEFSTLPRSGDVLTIGGTVYRVLRTGADGQGLALRLDLGERYASG